MWFVSLKVLQATFCVGVKTKRPTRNHVCLWETLVKVCGVCPCRQKILGVALPFETTEWRKAKGEWSEMYGHVSRRDDGHVLRKALEFEVKGKRKQGRPKKMWKTRVEKESKSVGLKKEDALKQARWRVGVGEIAGRVG